MGGGGEAKTGKRHGQKTAEWNRKGKGAVLGQQEGWNVHMYFSEMISKNRNHHRYQLQMLQLCIEKDTYLSYTQCDAT